MSNILSNVSRNGLGLMNLTWRPHPIEYEVAFAVMNEAINLNLPKQTLFNGGEFYGDDNINLVYIRDFFAKYPEQRQHVVVSIKGSVDMAKYLPVPTKEGISASIDNALTYIPDLDIYEPARLNPDVPFEETAAALDAAIDSGKIKAYTLSEVSGPTLSKFSEIAKHRPVGVELEFSLFTRELIDNGAASVAGQLNIPIIAYSPLAKGFLGGEIKSAADIPHDDSRLHLERFKDGNIEKNIAVVNELVKIAETRKVSPAQLAIAWLHYHSGKTIDGVKFPIIIPIPSSNSLTRVQENFAAVTLSDEEFDSINEIIKGKEIHGHRYNANAAQYLSV